MISKNYRSFICGIKGLYLTKNENIFLKKYKPWGIILFSRNIKTIKQTQILTNSIKKIFNNKNFPILIDEEGGRVSRLRKFIDNSIFSAQYFGNLYTKDKTKSKGIKNILLLNIRPITIKKVAVHLTYQDKSPFGVTFFNSFIKLF